jgi:hypothetical protein
VTLHAVSEIDSGKMDAVIRIFAGIGDENDCGIELAHHMRKPAAGTNGDYDVHDIRGVAAITDAVRAARVLNRMNEKDGESAGCVETERLSRFRVDRAKGNYSPAQAATWRQFISVELANGDDVGVVAPWNFPGQGENTPEKVAADQKAETVFLRLLDKFIGYGVDVSLKAGSTYAPAKFADEPEAKAGKIRRQLSRPPWDACSKPDEFAPSQRAAATDLPAASFLGREDQNEGHHLQRRKSTRLRPIFHRKAVQARAYRRAGFKRQLRRMP